MRSAWLVVVVAICSASPCFAQTTYRLRGTVRTDTGTPVDRASVRAEAIAGFRAGEFAGARELTATTNKKGEWSILGITSGMWVFEVTSAESLPEVIVLPVKFVTRDVNNAGAGALLTWELPLTVQAAADQPGLVDVAKQAASGRGRYAADVLATLITPSASEATLSAAGEIALLARHWEDARLLFMRVLASNDKSARARLGLASAALMARDYDAGTKLLWAARDIGASNVKPALSAAIGDLQQIVATR